jgi:hypothetical protein
MRMSAVYKAPALGYGRRTLPAVALHSSVPSCGAVSGPVSAAPCGYPALAETHLCRSSRMYVLVQDSAEAVTSVDA